ncbi:MAG: 1,4-dihydroxy-2-naphthoate polyprenyltransferase [Actinobacteria bacterium]|nr:1,4-dihydroxy-2-naphthoate polyprenyltransferase [Actinomycetota bacterium]
MATRRAWLTAARPHTLPAALTPVLVGAGLAYGDGAFRGDAFGWALLGAVAIQVAANFANDASDARRGADTPARLGPPRMVALGEITTRQMWVAAWLAVGVAAVAGIALTMIAGPVILIIGVSSVIAMLGYVGGPAPYGYRGLGEVFTFVFFGLVATVGSRYVHDMSAPLESWLFALPIGMLVTAILVVNNLRDIETDETAGKRTLAVVLGYRRTRLLFAILVVGAFASIAMFALAGWTPLQTALAALLAPAAIRPLRAVYRKTGPALNRVLAQTARLHLAVGVALALGTALS